MKKIFNILLLLLVISGTCYSLEVPALKGRVNDYAGMLSPAAEQKIEAKLAQFERDESTQVVVLTIPTLAGEDLEEYSIKVGETWKIGRKGIDSGVILLVVLQERKIRIEVGRGLEGVLTDLHSGQIRREVIGPRLRAGDYDGGVMAGVDAIMKAVKGEFEAKRDLRQGKPGASPIFTLLIFLFVACIFLGAISRFLGGVAGAAGLPLVASMSYAGLPVIALGGLALLGFFGGLLVSFLFGGGGRGGRFGGPYFGGGFGGGTFGGGGGWSGGGFSGGGGTFGGGGASGDW